MLYGPNVASLEFALYTKQISWELSLIFDIFCGSIFHSALFSMNIHWFFFGLTSSDILLFSCCFLLFCSLFSCLSHQGLYLMSLKVNLWQVSPWKPRMEGSEP